VEDGSSVIGAGATIVTGSSDVSYTAQWVARIYTISYDWNGGRGTAVADVNYTFGTTAITLPLVGDRVRDGYTFAGWSESLVEVCWRLHIRHHKLEPCMHCGISVTSRLLMTQDAEQLLTQLLL
jgi:hypothetical protein